MIKDQLIKVIQNVVLDSNVDSNSWQSGIEQHKTIPSIFYLFNTVELYFAYYSKNSSINLSLVVYNNK